MPQARITKRTVDTTLPGGRDVFVWDTDTKGFGLKVTPNGVKTYVVQYRMGGEGSKTKRFTLGRHGVLTPDKARDMAIEALIKVRMDNDPAAERKKKRKEAVNLAFERYVDVFLERYARRNKSYSEIKRVFDRNITPIFKGRPLPQITRNEVSLALEELTVQRSDAVGNYAHANLRKLFKWALERGDIPHSPMEGMRPPGRVKARDRVLSDVELKAVWVATDELGEAYSAFVRLLIATGQRRSEVGGLDWVEIDREREVWTIPAERAKNGKSHIVPLNALALEILDDLGATTQKRGAVFSTVSNVSRAKRKLDAEATQVLRTQMEDDEATIPLWRIHDLRRTLATGLQRLGVRLEVTEAVLGHISGSRAGIVGVYQRHDWAEEKRAALDAWGVHVQRLIDGSSADNVISLSERGWDEAV